MTCNYFDYQHLTDRLFVGVALTEEHLNAATEKIRQYLVSGGAAKRMEEFGIGIRVIEHAGKEIRRRLVYVRGKNEGQELTIPEIKNIGMLLKHGPYENMKAERMYAL